MKSLMTTVIMVLLAGGADAFTLNQQTPVKQISIHHESQLFSANPSMESDVVRSMSLDLPKNALPFREDKQKVEALMSIEVAVGRVAMVAALIFFGVEVTTDMSIPQQLASLSMFS